MQQDKEFGDSPPQMAENIRETAAFEGRKSYQTNENTKETDDIERRKTETRRGET